MACKWLNLFSRGVFVAGNALQQMKEKHGVLRRQLVPQRSGYAKQACWAGRFSFRSSSSLWVLEVGACDPVDFCRSEMDGLAADVVKSDSQTLGTPSL